MARTELSATFAMASRARALRAEGKDVISLSIGEPDFPTPPHVIEAAFAQAKSGDTKYPPVDGQAALKDAIVRKFKRDNGLDVAPEEIIVTNGGKQGIFNLVMALADPGDEVLIPAPAWAGYEQVVHFAGATPVFLPPGADLRPDPASLDAAITPRTKLLILNFPNNPSGATLPEAELAAIAGVLRRHPHLAILSDDIYEHLIFDGSRHATLAAIAPDLRDRTVTLSGISKSYAMTGWRLGFCAAPRGLVKAMTIVQGTATAGVCTIAQAAAIAALDGPQDLLAERMRAYRDRRDAVLAILAGVPGLACPRPDGAFYLFPSLDCIGRTSPAGRRITTDTDFAEALLEEALVATVPGSAFAASPHIRLSTASSEATLTRAATRIAEFCASLR